MIKKIEKIKSWQLIAFSALFIIAAFISKNRFMMVREMEAKKDGSLAPFTLTADDFTLVDLEKRGETFAVTSNDCQMIIQKDTKLTGLRFTMEYTVTPGEIVVYYREKGDGVFSEKKRRWAYPDDSVENGYMVNLPIKDVEAIRLDPSMYPGNILTFGEFSFNEEKTFSDYFKILPKDVFELILYTALFSACLKYRQEFILKKFN